MIEAGTRVKYHPNGRYSYDHLREKSGTVKYHDLESDWVGVAFDYRPQLGILPCAADELEVI